MGINLQHCFIRLRDKNKFVAVGILFLFLTPQIKGKGSNVGLKFELLGTHFNKSIKQIEKNAIFARGFTSVLNK